MNSSVLSLENSQVLFVSKKHVTMKINSLTLFFFNLYTRTSLLILSQKEGLESLTNILCPIKLDCFFTLHYCDGSIFLSLRRSGAFF